MGKGVFIAFSSEQEAEIIRLYVECGMSTRAIHGSLNLSCDHKVISRVLRNAGVGSRPSYLTKRRVKPDQEKLLVDEFESGESIADMASRRNLCESAILRTLHRLGVPQIKASPFRHDKESTERVVAEYLGGTSPEKLAKKYGGSELGVRGLLGRAGIKLRNRVEGNRKYTFNEAALDEPLADAGAFFVGFLMADGCVTKTRNANPSVVLEVAATDGHIVEAFRAFLTSSHPVYYRTRPAILPQGGKVMQDTACLSIRSARLADSLARYGVVPRKSWCAKATGGIETSASFWRGCVDGDGTVSVRPYPSGCGFLPFVSLCGTLELTQQFADFIRTLVPRFRGQPHRDHQSWAITASGRIAFAVIKEMYADATVSLRRKQEAAARILAAGAEHWGA